MIKRRDLIIGAACVAGAGSAYALKPSELVSLMPAGKKLSDILPRQFGDWTSRDVSDLVAPETPDSLQARLYGETVGRIYHQSDADVMMLMAHGDIQSNELQLHRPEICYPAFGFTIAESNPIALNFARSVSVPGRRLLVTSSEREETILYWTRLGEFFPQSVTEQRLERLETAMRHYIPDGLLARFSVAGQDTEQAVTVVKAFIRTLVLHVSAEARRALIGTERAAALAQVSPPRRISEP